MNSISNSLCILVITFNEAHNLKRMFQNLEGFASEICIVDSFSSDSTVDIALDHGAKVVQRKFKGFGDQWNFALDYFQTECQWTMKLDPDEVITDELKVNIVKSIKSDTSNAFSFNRRLFFMGKKLMISDEIFRLWKTGSVNFSNVLVNEHPITENRVNFIHGELDHYDSPDLHHWFAKQNSYSSAEALSRFRNSSFSVKPNLFGNSLQRRMFYKWVITIFPLRSSLIFFYYYFIRLNFLSGKIGYIWSTLRASVYRMRALKYYEMKLNNSEIQVQKIPLGKPHPLVEHVLD